MKKYNYMKFVAAIFIFLCFNLAQAEGMMMARTKQTFPEAMLKLQDTIAELGYSISRVQRIDIGLTGSGYATDKYRIVFFAKKDEIEIITKLYPHLIPFVPWKIAIFAEQQDTLLVATDPMLLSNSKFKGADLYLVKWKKDIKTILDTLRESS